MRAHLHLTFPEHLIDEPVLYQMGRDFDVVPNIRRANVDDRFAWVIVSLEGSESEIARVTAWLEEHGVEIKRLEDVP